MDEDNATEPEPTTSKKESQKSTSGNELNEDKDRDDHSANSECCSSAGSYSVKSRLNMVGGRADGPKQPIISKKESKLKDRRRKGRGDRRRRGRIEKRKRSEVHRQVVRRPPKRRPRMERRREQSVSTIFTRLSPGSPRRDRSPGCKYCGHRCCLRRCCHRHKRVRFKRIRKNKKPGRQRKKILPSEYVQAGSRCIMLSPLLVKTHVPPKQTEQEGGNSAKITPEMLYESLRTLTMWKEGVKTSVLMDHIKRYYPVERDPARLLTELREKLRVAVLIGIIIRKSEEIWCLSSALKKRGLTRNHVTLFWKAYLDAMRPVARKRAIVIKPKTEDMQTNTALTFDRPLDDVII